MNSIQFFAFFCTQPAGWESEDISLLLTGLIPLVVIVGINYKLKVTPPRRTILKNIVLGVSVVLAIPLLLFILYIIWLAPC